MFEKELIDMNMGMKSHYNNVELFLNFRLNIDPL